MAGADEQRGVRRAERAAGQVGAVRRGRPGPKLLQPHVAGTLAAGGFSLVTIAPTGVADRSGLDWPASSIRLAMSWIGTVCVIDRMTAYLSARRASCGISSPTWKPGTAVGIGLYGPRSSAGAFGFGSQESSWERPPYW